MAKGIVTPELIEQLKAIVGEKYVYTDKDSADHVGQKVDDYYANKFARLFLDNAGSSVGMGINSATDAHTRCDESSMIRFFKRRSQTVLFRGASVSPIRTM